ncbi:MAG TPA: DUF1802 family protein [Isosphaeraceae bacterium]|nr:DUF1802 family protein [Isosphaeraceae bacterium]
MNWPPSTCSVAFKEWAGICRALTLGRQSVILRKGGIAEDSGTFEPEHRAFWLYPTRLHEPVQGLREDVPGPEDAEPTEPGLVPIRALVTVDQVCRLSDFERVRELEPLHVWTEETVRKRFEYRTPGLWVLGVRVWAWATARRIAERPEYAGCRSWVPLHEGLSTEGLAPVLHEERHGEAMSQLTRALGPLVPDRTEGAGGAV